MLVCEKSLKDPYHSAAMLSLGGKPRPDANSVRGLPCKNKAFHSPETHHGRRVIRVYCFSFLCGLGRGIPLHNTETITVMTMTVEG